MGKGLRIRLHYRKILTTICSILIHVNALRIWLRLWWICVDMWSVWQLGFKQSFYDNTTPDRNQKRTLKFLSSAVSGLKPLIWFWPHHRRKMVKKMSLMYTKAGFRYLSHSAVMWHAAMLFYTFWAYTRWMGPYVYVQHKLSSFKYYR